MQRMFNLSQNGSQTISDRIAVKKKKASLSGEAFSIYPVATAPGSDMTLADA